MDPNPETALDTIVELAMQIAAQSPDVAEPATRIASLARGLGSAKLDAGALRDALASTTAGNDMSDADVSATVDRAVGMSRDGADD